MNKTRWFLLSAAFCGIAAVDGVGSPASPPPRQLRAAVASYRQHLPQLHNRRYLTLIDYTKPLYQDRLWVIDQTTGKTVLRAHVAHAFRSGLLHAVHFSNEQGSRMSCAGTFITGKAYRGRFGRALRVTGLDPENDHASARAIVFHSTRCTPFTWGCFATLPATNQRLIALIKDGSLVYVAR